MLGDVLFQALSLGRQFTLLTDQVVMKYLKAKTSPIGPVAGFILESREFQYEVEHVPGKEHTPADCLSRARDLAPDLETMERQERVYMSLQASLTTLTKDPSVPAQEHLLCRLDLVSGQLGDSGIQAIRTLLLTQPESKSAAFYAMKDGLVHYRHPQEPQI